MNARAHSGGEGARYLALFLADFRDGISKVGWSGCVFQRLLLIPLFLSIGTLFGVVFGVVDDATSFGQVFETHSCTSALNWG